MVRLATTGVEDFFSRGSLQRSRLIEGTGKFRPTDGAPHKAKQSGGRGPNLASVWRGWANCSDFAGTAPALVVLLIILLGNRWQAVHRGSTGLSLIPGDEMDAKEMR